MTTATIDQALVRSSLQRAWLPGLIESGRGLPIEGTEQRGRP